MTADRPRRRATVWVAALAGLVAAVWVAAPALTRAADAVFDDVTAATPLAAEIETAHALGQFAGYGDGTFRPDSVLTAGQARRVLERLLSYYEDDDGASTLTRAEAAAVIAHGICAHPRPIHEQACTVLTADGGEPPDGTAPGGAPGPGEGGGGQVDAPPTDGGDAAPEAPTTTVPVTTEPPFGPPPAPATPRQRCIELGWWDPSRGGQRLARTAADYNRWEVSSWPTVRAPGSSAWGNSYVRREMTAHAAPGADLICAIASITVRHDLRAAERSRVTISVQVGCLVEVTDPILGTARTARRYLGPYSRVAEGLDAAPEIRLAHAGDPLPRTSYPAVDPAACVTDGRSW